MGRRFTLDQYLKEFADEEGISVPDSISVHVTDAEVHSLGLFFIRFMGGLVHCLRTPPRRHERRRSMKAKKEQESYKEAIDGATEEHTTDDEDLIH